MAASGHADTPHPGKPVTSGSATSYTTPVDVNFTGHQPHNTPSPGDYVGSREPFCHPVVSSGLRAGRLGPCEQDGCTDYQGGVDTGECCYRERGDPLPPRGKHSGEHPAPVGPQRGEP